MNVVYILRCSDGTLYTGWTNDIKKRLKAHNQGSGAKYTRGRTPVELVYLEKFETKQEAMKREAAIKRLKKEDKLGLIAACDVEAVLETAYADCDKKIVQKTQDAGSDAKMVLETKNADCEKETVQKTQDAGSDAKMMLETINTFVDKS